MRVRVEPIAVEALHELACSQGQHLGSDQPADIRPGQQRQQENDRRKVQREHAGHDQQQDERGHSEQGVDDPHQEGVNDAADHAGDRPVESTDHRAGNGNREPELQRRLTADHQPAEYVDPVLVGAERVAVAGRQVLQAQVDRGLVRAVDQRPDKAEQDQQ
jgi:hypothetical protein